MEQNNSPTPQLTLDPFAGSAPAAPETPLAPAPQTEQMPALSPEEQEMVNAFAAKIDLHNATEMLQYGAGAQRSRTRI